MAKFDLLTTLLLDTAGFSEGIEAAKTELIAFKTSIKNFGSGIMDLLPPLAMLGSGFEMLKGVIESTQGSSEAFKGNLGLLEGSFSGLFATIATGDWTNLISNISNTAKATRDLKKAQDDLTHSSAGRESQMEFYKNELEIARVAAASTSDPKLKAQYLQDAITAQKAITTIEVAGAQDRLDVQKNFIITKEGWDKEEADYNINEVSKIGENYEYWFGKNSVALEGLKTQFSNLQYKSQVEGLTDAEKKEENQLKLTIGSTELYQTLLTGLGKGTMDNLIIATSDVSKAHADGEQALVKLSKQLTEATTATTQEMNIDQEWIKTAKEYTDWQNRIEKNAKSMGLAIYALDTATNKSAMSMVKIPSIPTAIEAAGGNQLQGVGMADIGGNWIKGADAIQLYITKLQQEREEAKKTAAVNKDQETELQVFSTTMQSLGTAFGNLAAGQKGAMKSMVTAVIEGLKSLIDAYLAVAIAATTTNDMEYGGPTPIALILAATGVAALLAFWQAKVPNFASGGISMGGLSLVGEHGRELVNLPKGSQVFSNSQTNNILNSGPSQVIFKFQDGALQGKLEYDNRRVNSHK